MRGRCILKEVIVLQNLTEMQREKLLAAVAHELKFGVTQMLVSHNLNTY